MDLSTAKQSTRAQQDEPLSVVIVLSEDADGDRE